MPVLPHWNAPPRAIRTRPRTALLALAAAMVAAAALALRPRAHHPPAERPVFVRRPDVLPTIVVSTPPSAPDRVRAGR